MNVGRTADFERSSNLETVLSEINTGITDCLQPPYSVPKHPVVFILGAPRCGTTLMLQWLAASGRFSYPSNLIARFFGNPYLGARIQQALHTFDPQQQIFGAQSAPEFASDLGRTNGALAASEYWYFWRRFFEFGQINKMSDSELANVDTAGFLEGIAGIEAAQKLPFVAKAMIMNWHVPFLDRIVPNALFIDVRRDPFFNAQSLLFARERFFGDRNRWYSFKPPEYEEIRGKPAPEQVVAQIYHSRRAVTQGLQQVDENRKLVVDYSAFCADPANIYGQILGKLEAQGYVADHSYNGPPEFHESRRVRLEKPDEEAIRTEINRLDFSTC